MIYTWNNNRVLYIHFCDKKYDSLLVCLMKYGFNIWINKPLIYANLMVDFYL